MMLSKEVKIKWNSKNKKHYEELGYEYTKMGDTFNVKVEDLTRGSNVLVDIECDYCHKPYQTKWIEYLRAKKKDNQKDCCSNPECTGKKSAESLIMKYGTSNIREIPGVNEKIAITNIQRYGVENPSKSKEVIDKIKETNMKKYGVEWYMQTEEGKQRYRDTCLERYGVTNYSYTDEFIKNMSGENSPVWKGNDNKISRERARNSTSYKNWRKAVFDRDCYTCQCCGARNGNGKYIRLVAHHIENWSSNVDKRFEIKNGITLCIDCHIAFHSCYGIKNNNKEQIDEFIALNNPELLDEKIC